MPRALKKVLDIVTTVALVLFVIFVIMLAGVRLFGIEPHIVLSGSMEPEIMTGSLVYVKPISPEEAQKLEVGDTVTYLVDKRGTKVTHKIYEVVGPAYVKDQHGEFVLDENGEKKIAVDTSGRPIYMYTTYGINNKNEGEESGYTLDGKLGVGNLASTNVVGKPVFSIPFVGYIANYVQNPPGQYIAIGGCAILLIMTLFTSSKDDPDGKKPKKKKGGEDPALAEPVPETPIEPVIEPETAVEVAPEVEETVEEAAVEPAVEETVEEPDTAETVVEVAPRPDPTEVMKTFPRGTRCAPLTPRRRGNARLSRTNRFYRGQ